jgi:hypothetical protein
MVSRKKTDLDSGGYPHLCFVIDKTLVSRFSLLLQRGVMVRALVSCTVKGFLSEQIGLSPDAIDRIQSIILDGSPVDDLDSAIIKDGSSLALSAAMPGLVGATLRRGGAYSSLRSSITHRETAALGVSGDGLVQIKLFNLLMNELGYDFLRKGIFVSSYDLKEFLTGQSRDFWQGCRQVIINGKPIEPGSLEDSPWLSQHDQLYLSVTLFP